jgi:hypothetical protein
VGGAFRPGLKNPPGGTGWRARNPGQRGLDAPNGYGM